jgi:hypothetical protein
MRRAEKLLLCGALFMLCLSVAGADSADSEAHAPTGRDAEPEPVEAPPRPQSAVEAGREDKQASDAKTGSPKAASEAAGTAVDMDQLMMVVGAIATLCAMAGGWFLMNQGGPRKRRFKGDAIFLVGPCDSGKTSAMLELRDGKTGDQLRLTHTSMQFNESTFAIADAVGKPVRIIDFPGHSRLRPQLFDMIEDCAALVFVIDACTFASKGLPCS